MTKEFSYAQFLPLDSLEKRKLKQRIRISVVIPARNEATTIGHVIAAINHELMQKTQLIDELFVIDGHSTDETVKVARAAGAQVVPVATIRPEIRVALGKGSAMYKSLFIVSGDIVVFCDADIVNFDTRFIYGLIAPMLYDKEILFSKACYDRPLMVNGIPVAHFGGRVTEIAVRPLLSLFYPKLARIRQPLSGEYALRTTIAKSLPFSSGYGVEMELLLNMYRQYGLKSIAQVDMGTRWHRNRPVEDLGNMSFGIMQTIIRHCKEDNKLETPCPLHNEMISFNDDGYHTTSIRDERLDPINSL